MTTFPDFPGELNESVLSVYNPSNFDLPVELHDLESIIGLIQSGENITFELVELVYVDEEGIIEINKKYLERDYVTDIISFNYNDEQDSSPSKEEIEGTLYCCAPRIAEQSSEMASNIQQEFYRIFIHGLLHLAGYNDTSKDEKNIMTQLENHYLEQLKD
ncbi:rRNA maturation RNase YbeY [Rhodohalobacter sulfatireducens]|uniref:Endoribonuclease YbeY n=1 Tax=Rhodohalobacter sulfatireducens TaxID=2911366 RepID=A0ABS9KGV2_9BACT|nr:rRNA maturation RNase YbeY [Rhodohalobacter sulfatireducens]MCG2590060.1 rRNA maturation RNase YbeY [Rhodohalobacter sulfatireducens]